MKKLSIIIPVYNVQDYLYETLNSIRAQTFLDWECILVDDGSSDDSGRICDEYSEKDSRFQVFHKKNGGVSSARNMGLSKATGDWITFIDSDDSIEPGYFNLNDLETVDFAIQGWRFSNESVSREVLSDGIYRGTAFVQFMNENLHKDILRMSAAKFLRRSIIVENNIEFDERIRLGEDTVFMMNYYAKISSVSVNNSSHYLYYRPDNWGSSKFNITKKEYAYFSKQFYSAYKKMPYQSNDLVTFIFSFYRSMIADNSLLTKLYINSLPEYLFFYKSLYLKSGLSGRFKYCCYRILSSFR